MNFYLIVDLEVIALSWWKNRLKYLVVKNEIAFEGRSKQQRKKFSNADISCNTNELNK